MVKSPRAGPIGRFSRLALGIGLAVITLPVYFGAGATYNLSSLGLTVGLVVLYTLIHLVVSRFLIGLNPWVGAVLVVIPVFLVWFLGQGGGPLFGQGEGGTAALTFLTVSFLVDFARADSGCEVMALPGLLTGERTHMPCLLLCPIDHAEAGQTTESIARD